MRGLKPTATKLEFKMKNMLRIAVLITMAGIAGCMQLTDPATTGSSPDPSYNANDPSFGEVADNPLTSPYYTEPDISYGYPGDGLADNYDTSSTYLASVSYAPTSTSAKGGAF